jgi:hypothetical protein
MTATGFSGLNPVNRIDVVSQWCGSSMSRGHKAREYGSPLSPITTRLPAAFASAPVLTACIGHIRRPHCPQNRAIAGASAPGV